MTTVRTLLISFLLTTASLSGRGDFVVGCLYCQLGNQLCQVAATCAVAWNYGVSPIFPDFANPKRFDLHENYEMVFWRLETTKPWKTTTLFYKDFGLGYRKIPYKPNMAIMGNFQSYRYFYPYKNRLVELLSPKEEIVNDIYERYSEIIDHPKTVGVHVRTYMNEDPIYDDVIRYLGKEYFEYSMSQYDEDSLFVVFSDQIEWIKEEFSDLPYKMVFVDGQSYIHDFFMMTMMKNLIISNSTFSWWAAYLNQSPERKIIAPQDWYNGKHKIDSKDLFDPREQWIVVPKYLYSKNQRP